MADALTNYIKFDQDDLVTAKGRGLISTLERDFAIEVVPFESDNPKAPTHQIFAKSPTGYSLSIGGIWKKKNQWDADYFMLIIRSMGFKANLGRFAGQDDASLQAIIEWDERSS